ncbi:hypothetical protein Krac_11389 [Ktedonobacter racemifer DSM 44963]|uniref:Uncharacterized protein n=1 Tax=Ktedonobacter racemifer DSM 44963 TaxID=485913 RepID=D6TBN4_KTERA|nr:hypothetical protein Krac_11389 [Ktedonobacter racemifer DSM 44963]
MQISQFAYQVLQNEPYATRGFFFVLHMALGCWTVACCPGRVLFRL